MENATEYTLKLECRLEKLPAVYLPTEAELATVGEFFTCFSCLERLPISKFAGNLSNEHICRRCRPYLDDWAVGLMRKFDNRQKASHSGKVRLGRPGDAIPEDWELTDEGWVKTIPAPKPVFHKYERARVSFRKEWAVEDLRNAWGRWDTARLAGWIGINPPKDAFKPAPVIPSSVSWDAHILDVVKSSFAERRKQFEEKEWIWVIPLLIADRQHMGQ